MLSVGRVLRTFNQSHKQLNYGSLMLHRNVSMHTINDNLYLCTEKPRRIDIDKKSLRFTQVRENKKPLVLMISWFYGKPSQINKYSQLYTDKGMDVLVGRISLAQFLLKIGSIEKFGQNITDILHSNEDHYNEIFIHTFSAGGCMWGTAIRMMKKNMAKYGNIPNRVIGQIWDSVAHPKMTIVAIPFALYPKNLIMQNLVRGILWFHLFAYRPLQRHFDDAVGNFYQNMARAPALIFASKVDDIGTEEFAREVVGTWKKNGVDVTFKLFPDSPHIKHYMTYPKEYLEQVHEHWDRCKLLERK